MANLKIKTPPKNTVFVRYFFLSFCLLIMCGASAQKKILPTNSFLIEGAVNKPIKVSIKDLATYPEVYIDSMPITNHLRQWRHTLLNVKCVSLKSILDKVIIDASSPKDLSRYYLEFIASDNYTIVFSWNEIFNSPTGKHIFLLMEKDARKINEQSDRISMIVSTDFATGRRYLKGLKYIIIKKAD
ncbi:MAG TPA: hypothetical protein VFQ86_12800 [Arachidicoccus soli]|nr:hypothetical protein [Arachidicoccus soli]